MSPTYVGSVIGKPSCASFLRDRIWQQQKERKCVYDNMEFRGPGAGAVARKFANGGDLLQRALAKGLFSLALTLVLACLTCPRAWGDVGIVLNESMDTSLDRISGTGHSAVYFSGICPESPVRLRLCREDENGSVMSNYINIGEELRFEWN
ncbi:MAG: hypothetical protein DMG36_00215, partial [Acidobacteria bacterium]